jgi:hypothetical protein
MDTDTVGGLGRQSCWVTATSHNGGGYDELLVSYGGLF